MKYYNRYKKTERIKYYRQFLINVNMLQFFVSLLDKKETILINTTLRHNDLDFAESPHYIANQLGFPDFIFKDNELFPLVYLYRDTALSNSIITQFHFIDNKYSFASKTIIGFEEGWKSTIKMALYKKYLSDSSHNQSIMSTINNVLIEKCLCFTDNTGNKIIIIDDVFLHVLFVSSKVNLTKILLDFRIKENQKDLQKMSSVQKVLFEFI